MTIKTPLDEWTARRLEVPQLDRRVLEEWQLEHLREVVAWAREHSPFYRHLYRRLPPGCPATLRGRKPRGRAKLVALADLPLVQETDFRGHGLDMVCVSQGDIARIVTIPTSGSQGPPKRVWFTEEDLELTVDHFRHGMRALVSPGQRVLVLMPGATSGSVGWLLREALARDGVDAESYGLVDSCERVAKQIEDYGANCLVGLPGQLARVARSSPGRTLPRGLIKSVLTSGDHVARATRAAIEQAWDCHVFEHYGSTEMGLGGAVQCRAFAGLHVREADLLFEVIDPRTGQPLPDGQEGELVVTTLTRRGMPFIRFRTGDIASLAPGPCACGSVLRCVAGVAGRAKDAVDLGRGQSLSMGDLDERLFPEDWLMGFTAEVGSGPNGNRLMVVVEARRVPSASVLALLMQRLRGIESVRRTGTAVEVQVSSADAPDDGAARFDQGKRIIFKRLEPGRLELGRLRPGNGTLGPRP